MTEKKYTKAELQNIERACYLVDKLEGKLNRFCEKYKVKPEDAISKLREVLRVETN